MSVWSLACPQGVFQRYHSEKHLSEFCPKMAAKVSWHRNYVTVNLCILTILDIYDIVISSVVSPLSAKCPYLKNYGALVYEKPLSTDKGFAKCMPIQPLSMKSRSTYARASMPHSRLQTELFLNKFFLNNKSSLNCLWGKKRKANGAYETINHFVRRFAKCSPIVKSLSPANWMINL